MIQWESDGAYTDFVTLISLIVISHTILSQHVLDARHVFGVIAAL